MFKELFKKLFDASDGEKSKSPIWSEFRKENLTVTSLRETLSNIKDDISCKNDILSKFENIDSALGLLEAFHKEDEKFWENLFLILRDIGCEKISIKKDRVISVMCAGEKREVAFEDLNSRILTDYGDILNTQTAIPEGVLYEEDKRILMSYLKSLYDKLGKDKSEEECKSILLTIQQSPEAKRIKDMQSLEAEILVQNKMIELGKSKDIAMATFRGIKTYGYLGRFLEGFGVQFSKLRSVLDKNPNLCPKFIFFI